MRPPGSIFHRTLIIAGALAANTIPMLAGGCAGLPDDRARANAEPTARVVTADIQAGIEQHIDEHTLLGGGVFVLRHEDRDLRLRLARVHTEYLANLGPGEHFACVDLVNEDGTVYDVDFFLEGPPGDMRVTETIVHKLNGKPYYVWRQRDDGTWETIAVDDADRSLLGVIEGEDRFLFSYEFRVPELDGPARVWLPVPESDDFQTVEMVNAQTPVPWEDLRDREHGNKIMFMRLGPEHAGRTVRLEYDVHRLEKSAYPARGDPARALRAERFVPDDEIFVRTAAEVLEGKAGELVRARALYDFVIDSMEYQKYQDGYGQGDAMFACDSLTGNCTDYHSYFIALARAAGIPARFAIGAPIPSERDEGGISGYHCWAEFYAEGKWWPVDISEGDKYSALSTYYFGRHPANRVELTRGRDLVVEPGPASGPINFLAYPYIETDSGRVPLKPFFSFRRHRPASADACCEHHAPERTARVP